MRSILAIILILPLFCYSQNRGNVWTFGHHAAIDFTNTTPFADSSKVRSRGSCVSICDVSGGLLFYAFTRAGVFGNSALVYDRTHQQMLNGDNILGEGWYHELVIIPQPGSDSLYYLFCIGVTGSSTPGIFYSKIDITANGGLGAVIQKNVQLPNYFNVVDCLTAVKHGNGRDWWLMFRRWNSSPLAPNNEFHSYLISPAGITNYSVQSIGSIQSTGFGVFAWTTDGNRFAYSNLKGVLELYDFDRCTGIISNPVTVNTESSGPPWPAYWGAAFSPSSQFLYVTRIPLTVTDTSRLYQFDVTAANIAASADTLLETGFISQLGHLKLAPDGKIYLANNYYGVFPYADSVYNTYNMNLSVIENPDYPGSTCNVQPYSFYLGGKRTYFGLPNNPDYDLGSVAGSICDTLTGISVFQPENGNAAMFVTWVQDWHKLFLNAQGLRGKKLSIEILDATGKTIFDSDRLNQPGSGPPAKEGYYTQDISLPTLSSGVYVVRLISEKEVLAKKFVVRD